MTSISNPEDRKYLRSLGLYFYRHWFQQWCVLFFLYVGVNQVMHDIESTICRMLEQPDVTSNVHYVFPLIFAGFMVFFSRYSIEKLLDREAKDAAVKRTRQE